MIHEIILDSEKRLGIEEAERAILSGSFPGLFSVWSTFETDASAAIISILDSLWYDGFVEWMETQVLSPEIRKVCVLLGEKEKSSNEKRMATVEERAVAAANTLKEKTASRLPSSWLKKPISRRLCPGWSGRLRWCLGQTDIVSLIYSFYSKSPMPQGDAPDVSIVFQTIVQGDNRQIGIFQ